jgi:hypothetical protein
MIKDKKGEGGFLEALAALMVVTVALTAFLGMLSYSGLGRSDSPIDVDTSFIDNLEIRDGEITGETVSHLERFVDRNSLNGARLTVSVAGNICDSSRTDSVGDTDGNNAECVSGTFSIKGEAGCIYAAKYEVVFWWD